MSFVLLNVALTPEKSCLMFGSCEIGSGDFATSQFLRQCYIHFKSNFCIQAITSHDNYLKINVAITIFQPKQEALEVAL